MNPKRLAATIGILLCSACALWFWSAPGPEPFTTSQIIQSAPRRHQGKGSQAIREARMLKLLPASARTLVKPEENYREHLLALRQLSSDLAGAKNEDLQNFLKGVWTQDKTDWGRTLKNAIMDFLCRSDAEGASRVLLEVFEDRSQDPIVRDYALQHLIEYTEVLSKCGRTQDADLSETVQALWDATAETGGTIAGTALLGLSRLSDTEASLDKERVEEKALQLARDDSNGNLTRATAVQVCARMKVASAVPVLEKMLDSESSVLVKAALVGALGGLDDSAVAPLLRKLADTAQETTVRVAAQGALQQMAEFAHLREQARKEQLERLRVEQWKHKS